MSAIPPKADTGCARRVRFVPEADLLKQVCYAPRAPISC
jgi:uncharacterized protein